MTTPGGAFDLLVVGSGIAGLVAALTAAPRCRVAVLTKGVLGGGATGWAQGGIAAALAADDSPEQHFADTMEAGRGLCDPAAVRILVEEGPARVASLRAWGVDFDSEGERLRLGREAAHSRNRIVHAGGDATGAEIERALLARLRGTAVTVIDHAHASGLLVDDRGRCAGAETVARDGTRTTHGATAVVLAGGGAGQLWRNTTNPPGAGGEGIALAWDAGAEVGSLEFVQFHPTALARSGAPRFLISEALRGEGAHVVDADGERFLLRADPRGELAGRDVVARAIWERLQERGEDHVLLDCRHLGERARQRFPTIDATLRRHGIDITTDLVPIAPAAHYTIGGVRTDLDGATTIDGLFACGEVASTGVHGANRLASNSLLEGAVFGHRAARRALQDIAERPPTRPLPRCAAAGRDPGEAEITEAEEMLRSAMWEGAGIVRDARGLRRALSCAEEILGSVGGPASRAAVALRQRATTARLVCAMALHREESRGAHVRGDHPTTDETWRDRLVMSQEGGLHRDCDA